MTCLLVLFDAVFFFQAEDGIRDLVRSRGLGDVYKRQLPDRELGVDLDAQGLERALGRVAAAALRGGRDGGCLLYTSDAADERSSVDLGGRRIIKKKSTVNNDRDARHIPQEANNTT